MDIHKPKPWQGSRELLKEIGTIVIGVLIALAAEQAVDWLRWRYEIGEARQALGQEITYNIKALRIMDQQNGCLVARMDVLSAWASGTAPRPAGPVRMPVLYSLQTSTWDVTNAGRVIVHFPLNLKTTYATLFPASATSARRSTMSGRHGARSRRWPISKSLMRRNFGDCARRLAWRGSGRAGEAATPAT